MRVEPSGDILVGRARFTEAGEIVEEPTFATEAELGGVRATQAPLMREFGERPIETAGPMFERAGAGGGPPRPTPAWQGVPPEGDFDSAVAKMTQGFRQSRKSLKETELTRSMERSQRLAASENVYKQAVEQGATVEEAASRSRAMLAGEYAKPTAAEFALTEPERMAVWKKIVAFDFGRGTGPDFERIRARDALLKLESQQPLQRNEILTLEKLYGKDFADALRKIGPRDWGLFDIVVLPKAVLSSFDVSYPLRQGAMAAPAHPKEFGASFLPMFKAFASENFAQKFDLALRQEETLIPVQTGRGLRQVELGEIFMRTGLLRDLEPGLSGAEEAFRGRLAERIPGLGRIVRASNRAFATFGNSERAGIARTVIASWQKPPLTGAQRLARPLLESRGVEITTQRLHDLGNLLNRFTGRGTLADNRLTQLLQATWWAPQYRVSGPEAAAQLLHRDPVIRKAAARNLVAFFGAGSALLAGAKYSGLADVEMDPRSSDFGKIRIGNMRLNIWGTNQLLARTVAQVATGQRFNRQLGRTSPVSWQEPIKRYFQSGLAPEWSAVYDAMQGQTYLGEPLEWDIDTFKREAKNRLIPLAIQDIIEAVEEYGLAGGLTAPFTLLGGGQQTYASPEERIAQAWNSLRPQERWQGSSAQWKKAEADSQLAPLVSEYRRQGLERETPGALRANQMERTRVETEQINDLPSLAQGVLAGRVTAGPQFVEALAKYQGEMAGSFRFAYLDSEPRAAGTPDDVVLQEYRGVRLTRDAEDQPEWDKFFAARDAALAKMSPELRRAVEIAVSTVDPAVQQVERLLKQAKDLRSEYYDMPRWTGIDAVTETRILEVRDRAEALNDRAVRQRLNPSAETTYKWAGQELGDVALARYAYWLTTKAGREKRHNYERDAFLVNNARVLEVFFPDLYRKEAIRRAVGEPEGAEVR